MKNFALELSSWKIPLQVQKTTEDGKPFIETEDIDYPIKDNLSMMLRAGGLFKNVEDTVEAVMLGKLIQTTTEDNIEIDERELDLLKKCLDKHLESAAEGKSTFGGQQHEGLVLRIHKLWKSKDKE